MILPFYNLQTAHRYDALSYQFQFPFLLRSLPSSLPSPRILPVEVCCLGIEELLGILLGQLSWYFLLHVGIFISWAPFHSRLLFQEDRLPLVSYLHRLLNTYELISSVPGNKKKGWDHNFQQLPCDKDLGNPWLWKEGEECTFSREGTQLTIYRIFFHIFCPSIFMDLYSMECQSV